MFSHPTPKRVLFGGGGEGATALEVFRHKSVVECVMVDIDPDVVKLCEEKLPEWSNGAFKDPRFNFDSDDVKKVLAPDGHFDVIILDLCDPLEYGMYVHIYAHIS